MPKKRTILIHYTHKGTLGHSTRVRAICHALSGTGTRIHILQAAASQPSIDFPPGVELHPVPHPFDSRLSFNGRKNATSLPLRAEFVMKTVKKTRPDIFVTEFFPFGRADYTPELLPPLRYLRAKGARIIASIGYPFLVQIGSLTKATDINFTRLLTRLYDQLLIHTPEQLENPYLRAVLGKKEKQTVYDLFFKEIRKKTIYTGYVLPCEEKNPPGILPAAPEAHSDQNYHILVSRGGGAVYPNIIACAIRAHRHLGNKYRMTVTCGPSTTPEEKKLFESCLSCSDRSRIRMFDHLPGLTELMRASHVSISMCGYNTSVQLLNSGTQSIIVPYINKTQDAPANDQQSRAILLKEKICSTSLNYYELKPKPLAEIIREKCERPSSFPSPPKEWFSGARRTSDILAG